MDTNTTQQTVTYIQLTSEQFQQIKSWFSEIFKSQQEQERLLSVDQVIDMLGVTRPTLWRWNNTGYLKKIMVGSKPRYRESDIKEIMSKR